MNEPVAAITFLSVDDLERSGRFYREVLGLALVEDQGWARVYRIAQGGYVGLVRSRTPVGAMPGHGALLSIVVEDVDAWYERLTSAPDIEIEDPPAPVSGIPVYSFFMRDPAGHRVEIQAFTDSAVADRFSAS